MRMSVWLVASRTRTPLGTGIMAAPSPPRAMPPASAPRSPATAAPARCPAPPPSQAGRPEPPDAVTADTSSFARTRLVQAERRHPSRLPEPQRARIGATNEPNWDARRAGATSLTHASGATLSSTMRSFSDVPQCRRRSGPGSTVIVAMCAHRFANQWAHHLSGDAPPGRLPLPKGYRRSEPQVR